MVAKIKKLFGGAMAVALCVALCACQSDASPQSDTQNLQPIMIDYSGIWMTACVPINVQQSTTSRLRLDNGKYRSQIYTYNGQDCSSTENQIYSLVETGTYTIGDTVEVPSGVVAHGVSLFVESRLRDGEPDVLSDNQVEGDFFHRDGNKLFRATGKSIGVAAIFVPEEINFSIPYYLQEE